MTEELKQKAEEYATHFSLDLRKDRMATEQWRTAKQAYIAGANENGILWHEIESKVSPKREISKQYMPKNKEKVLLKYHFSGDDEIHISDGYYDAYDFEFHIANNPKYRIVCVIAWSKIPTV